MKFLHILLNALAQYKVLFKYWIIFLSIGFVFRILQIFIFLDEINSDALYSILYGVRMDTIVFSAIGILFSLLYTFNFITFARIFLTLSFMLYLMIEIASIPFLSEFFSRPNYLFIQHLANYEEILLMVWELYMFYLIVLVPLLIYLIYKSYKFFVKSLHYSSIKSKLIALPLILAILFLGVRSSIDSSTPNQGFYTFSTSNMHNEIANNSIFSILYAKYLLGKEKFYKYGEVSNEQAIKNVKKLNNIITDREDLVRFQKSMIEKKKNIILVILESFGHEYIGHLGGTPTTPNLDALTRESLYFTNLYAVGTRTSWGISSITTSLYPIPSREYVTASRSQKNFYTVAKTLKNEGYETTFLYSGDADFDNMRGFLLSNGYDTVLGKENFSSNKHKYTWGYCDEDLYEKAFELIKQPRDKPYFLNLLTMSSHEPFDYPKGKTPLYKKAPAIGFENAVKYSDYAIGKFIKKLKDNNMLEDTVVAFVADHCSKAYAKMDVPIHKYKITAMIVSDDFKGGKKYDKIASQIDFAPTLLDVAGVSASIPTMGNSVLKHQRDSALLLARKKNFAYLYPEAYVVYKDKSNYQTYSYNSNKIQNDPKRIEEGLSFIYASKYLYKNELYK